MSATPDLWDSVVRADALAVLARYRPRSAAEATLRDQMLAFLATRRDGMRRSCVAGHVTASALVVDEGCESVLLLLHAKAGLWLQPGGHCEPGDVSLRATASREAEEETGIGGLRVSIDPLRIDRHVGPCDPRRPWHFDVQYLAVAPTGARPRLSSESHDSGWFGWDARDPPDASVVASVMRARARG